MRNGRMGALAVAAAVLAAATLAGGTAQAADGGELVPYPGPDGVVWVPEVTGTSGVVSAGLDPRLDTQITVGCRGGGTVEVTFGLIGWPDHTPVTFAVDCPADAPASRTVPLGSGLYGSFEISVTASAQDIRWGLAVVQPE